MRADIHPTYKAIHVTCSCGNTFTTGSTHHGDLHLEICSECHPFYTGKQKVIDTAGRVERFKRKYGMASAAKQQSASTSDGQSDSK